jgi:hypothetical protein
MSISRDIFLLALTLWASVTHAADVHAESSSTSVCSILKPGSAIVDGYVREITDLGLRPSIEHTIASWSFTLPFLAPGPPTETDEGRGRITKWARNPRIVILTDERIPTDLAYSTVAFRDEVATLVGRDQIPDIVWKPSASFNFLDGDLAIFLSPHLALPAETYDTRVLRLLQGFFESNESLYATLAKIDPKKPQSFTQLIGEGFRVDRAIVLLDTNQTPFLRSHELFQLLTFALHPAADSLNWESPIYRPEFRSQRQFDSPWTERFQVYLTLKLDSGIEPGMSRSEFAKAAIELLQRDSMQPHFRQVFRCDP